MASCSCPRCIFRQTTTQCHRTFAPSPRWSVDPGKSPQRSSEIPPAGGQSVNDSIDLVYHCLHVRDTPATIPSVSTYSCTTATSRTKNFSAWSRSTCLLHVFTIALLGLTLVHLLSMISSIRDTIRDGSVRGGLR